jgi:hypothetical protein
LRWGRLEIVAGLCGDFDPGPGEQDGPETGQMLSTYIVEVGQPIATFTG